MPKGESEALFRAIAGLPADVTVLFIEHDMDIVFKYAQTIRVLSYGKVLAEGSPDDVRRNPHVIEAYLGAHFEAKPA